MIDSLISQCVAQLQTLPFLTKVGGVVRSQKQNVGGTDKIYPVAFVESGGCVTANYTDFAPNSKEVGISYFELFENNPSAINGGNIQSFQARLRLMCWLNISKISVKDTGVLTAIVWKKLRSLNLAPAQHIRGAILTLEREEAKSASLFAKYTYDETESQYLMLPFDYFSMVLHLNYTVAWDCLPTVTVNNTEC